MKEKINVGKLKAILDRQLNYISKLQFVMVLYLFLDKTGWNWWYLLLIPVVLTWTYIDIKYIMKREIDYIWGKSETLKKLLKDEKHNATENGG